MKFFNNFGKREGLVYLIILFWIFMGILGVYKEANFADMSVYFGSLTAYAATYIWSESKRPSYKSSIRKTGPSSRREIMIYLIVVIWVIVGTVAILYKSNLNDLALYFISLSGFIASWIAGEVYTPQDSINTNQKDNI